MKPAPRALARRSIVGFALIGVLGLTLPACGDGGQPATGRGAAAQREERAEVTATGKRCRSRLGGFLDSLDALRSRLAVGLSYGKYLGDVRDARGAYDEIPIDRLTIDCLMKAGTPGERALNEYIDAANAWGGCLATVACESDSVEPELQRRWRLASGFLSAAQKGLREIRTPR